MEEQFLSLLLNELHLYLFMGIISVVYVLKNIGPVKDFIWGTDEQPSKYKWLVTVINVALSFFGIFVISMTPFTTANMKVVVALVISAVSTAAYEWAIKHMESLVKTRLLKNKDNSGG